MSDYVQYDTATGEIIRKLGSVDGEYIGITGKPGYVEVPHETFLAINKYSIVSEGKVVEMTEEQKAAVEKAVTDAKAAQEKIPTLGKLITLLIEKKLITLEEVENAKEVS